MCIRDRLGTNQSPLKAALLEQKLGADIDIGFDDSTLQPTLELVLRGATAETAPKFAAGVKQAVTDLLAGGLSLIHIFPGHEL